MTSETTSGPGTGPRVDYSYDNANRVTTIARTIGGSGRKIDSLFSYDNANRLTTLTHQVSGGLTHPHFPAASIVAQRILRKRSSGE
jgi:hypothetical protein